MRSATRTDFWEIEGQHIHCVDDTGDPSQDGQTDVDQEISTTSALQEYTQRRQDDGEDNLADVTVDFISTLDIDLPTGDDATWRQG